MELFFIKGTYLYFLIPIMVIICAIFKEKIINFIVNYFHILTIITIIIAIVLINTNEPLSLVKFENITEIDNDNLPEFYSIINELYESNKFPKYFKYNNKAYSIYKFNVKKFKKVINNNSYSLIFEGFIGSYDRYIGIQTQFKSNDDILNHLQKSRPASGEIIFVRRNWEKICYIIDMDILIPKINLHMKDNFLVK